MFFFVCRSYLKLEYVFIYLTRFNVTPIFDELFSSDLLYLCNVWLPMRYISLFYSFLFQDFKKIHYIFQKNLNILNCNVICCIFEYNEQLRAKNTFFFVLALTRVFMIHVMFFYVLNVSLLIKYGKQIVTRMNQSMGEFTPKCFRQQWSLQNNKCKLYYKR